MAQRVTKTRPLSLAIALALAPALARATLAQDRPRTGRLPLPVIAVPAQLPAALAANPVSWDPKPEKAGDWLMIRIGERVTTPQGVKVVYDPYWIRASDLDLGNKGKEGYEPVAAPYQLSVPVFVLKPAREQGEGAARFESILSGFRLWVSESGQVAVRVRGLPPSPASAGGILRDPNGNFKYGTLAMYLDEAGATNAALARARAGLIEKGQRPPEGDLEKPVVVSPPGLTPTERKALFSGKPYEPENEEARYGTAWVAYQAHPLKPASGFRELAAELRRRVQLRADPRYYIPADKQEKKMTAEQRKEYLAKLHEKKWEPAAMEALTKEYLDKIEPADRLTDAEIKLLRDKGLYRHYEENLDWAKKNNKPIANVVKTFRGWIEAGLNEDDFLLKPQDAQTLTEMEKYAEAAAALMGAESFEKRKDLVRFWHCKAVVAEDTKRAQNSSTVKGAFEQAQALRLGDWNKAQGIFSGAAPVSTTGSRDYGCYQDPKSKARAQQMGLTGPDIPTPGVGSPAGVTPPPAEPAKPKAGEYNDWIFAGKFGAYGALLGFFMFPGLGLAAPLLFGVAAGAAGMWVYKYQNR